MKELSIEQKAQRYDEVLNRAKKELDVCGSQDCDAVKQIFRFFPELKENKEPDDERVRKGLIELVKQSSEILEKKNQEQMIDWLEKQAEHANFRSKIQIGDKVTRNEDSMLVNLSQLNRVAKPADNAEPKFKVGDIICSKVWESAVHKIVSMDNSAYYFENGGMVRFDVQEQWELAEEPVSEDLEEAAIAYNKKTVTAHNKRVNFVVV